MHIRYRGSGMIGWRCRRHLVKHVQSRMKTSEIAMTGLLYRCQNCYKKTIVNSKDTLNPIIQESKSKAIIMCSLIRPRLELGTFCVLDRCDNQLRHRTTGHHQSLDTIVTDTHTLSHPNFLRPELTFRHHSDDHHHYRRRRRRQ